MPMLLDGVVDIYRIFLAPNDLICMMIHGTERIFKIDEIMMLDSLKTLGGGV